jgi:adenylosuccinate lyase
LIPRYSLPEMSVLFTDEARMAAWLEVELAAVDGWASVGVIPIEVAEIVRSRAPKVTATFVADVAAREAVTDHDLAAFVDVVQDSIGVPEGSWVHYGVTSSDVVDTALSSTLVSASDLLIASASGLVEVLKARAAEHISTPMVGRTHGQHAEPTTFGVKLALWCLQVDRDRTRLVRARDGIAVGKFSGAVGTYSNLDPRVEEYVCNSLGLRPVPATQVISRDRHAEYLYACASVGATVEAISTEIRHLARTEVAEVEEPFGAGQKGSSSMPHKRNPVLSERLSGLARVLRGYVQPGLEDVALWHERDISHSSVERVILPDASMLAYYLLRRVTGLIEGLVVNVERMLENLTTGSLGLLHSQAVLLALVASGMDRDSAYRIVQRDARAAWEQRRQFRDVLEADDEVQLDRVALDSAFDLEHSLRHTARFLDALEAVEP